MGEATQTGFFVEEVARRLRRGHGLGSKKPKQEHSFDDGRPRVASSGNPDTAKLVVVGEMPGQTEVDQGEAFVGESGQFLRRVIVEEMGLDPGRDVYYGNVIPYRAEELTTDAQKVRMGKRTVGYLLEELMALPGRPILGVGGVALGVLTKEHGITGERGILRHLEDGRSFFPTYHPAHLLRADPAVRRGLEKTFRTDLRRFGEWLQKPKRSPVGRMVKTEKELRDAQRYLSSRPLLFFDFETPSLAAWAEPIGQARILAVGFSSTPGEAIGIAIDLPDNPLPVGEAKKAVSRILASPGAKGGLHLQHDLHWARMAGFEVVNVRWDDMLAATLLAYKPYTEIRSNLLRLAADWLGEIEYPWWQVDKTRMAEYPAETVVGVAMTDAEWELRLHHALWAELAMRKRAI